MDRFTDPLFCFEDYNVSRNQAIARFLVVHYNIAVEDERNVVYKSGGREQERGGRLVYLPNSSGRLEPLPSK